MRIYNVVSNEVSNDSLSCTKYRIVASFLDREKAENYVKYNQSPYENCRIVETDTKDDEYEFKHGGAVSVDAVYIMYWNHVTLSFEHTRHSIAYTSYGNAKEAKSETTILRDENQRVPWEMIHLCYEKPWRLYLTRTFEDDASITLHDMSKYVDDEALIMCESINKSRAKGKTIYEISDALDFSQF